MGDSPRNPPPATPTPSGDTTAPVLRLPFHRLPWIRRIMRWAQAPVVDFVHNDGQVYAAAMAFYGIVSLVPLGAVFIAVGGAVLANLGKGNAADQAALISDTVLAIQKFVPLLPKQATESVLRSMVASRGDLGLFGALGLVISASQVVRAIRTALQRIFWGLSPLRPTGRTTLMEALLALLRWLRGAASASLVIVLVGLVFAGSRYLLASVLNMVKGVAPTAWVKMLQTPVLAFLLGQTSAFLFSAVGFMVLVAYVVRKAASWRAIALGAVCFGLLQAVGETLYGYYVVHYARLSLTHGSMATLVAVALWVFVSSCAFLLCAQLTAEARLWGIPLARRNRIRRL